MIAEQKCSFFLLRYVPDAVKNEFVNVGLVLLPETGRPEVRFTHDWSRAKCLDPQADMDLLGALEADLRGQLLDANGGRDQILRKIQDSFSNAVQASEFKACLAESPATEADTLARIYLETSRPTAPREASARQAIFGHMRQAFESAGVWPLMGKDIRASDYTRPGDPLKIDCGYSPRGNGTVKMFHALSLPADASAVNAAKLLAFSFPHLAEGIRKKENKHAQLTAVVEDGLQRQEESISFAVETLEQQKVQVATLREMPQIAALAARELGIG
jgi:Protein of unknown function (DUF3037)